MKGYRKKEKKAHLLAWVIGEFILIFIIATISIVLYDIYIHIDTSPEESYVPVKITKEVNTEEVDNISETLESVSKSVVRHI